MKLIRFTYRIWSIFIWYQFNLAISCLKSKFDYDLFSRTSISIKSAIFVAAVARDELDSTICFRVSISIKLVSFRSQNKKTNLIHSASHLKNKSHSFCKSSKFLQKSHRFCKQSKSLQNSKCQSSCHHRSIERKRTNLNSKSKLLKSKLSILSLEDIISMREMIT
jgi:hypothetical protein